MTGSWPCRSSGDTPAVSRSAWAVPSFGRALTGREASQVCGAARCLGQSIAAIMAAADRLPEAWDSPVSTDTVRAHLYRYGDAFDDSASRAHTRTQQASWHGEQSAQARSDIPPPQQFTALRGVVARERMTPTG